MTPTPPPSFARIAWMLALATFVACAPRTGGSAVADATRSPVYDAGYRALWRDGNAELAGYALTYPRYGQKRKGTAVMITVTEPFDERSRVKPERVTDAHYQVIKLNLVQDFATGIYDYNMMTSAFVATDPVVGRPPGSTTKVSFSSQEWCGHVYAQLRFDRDAVQLTSHSYFEGEADQDLSLKHPRDGLSEDALPLWARGLAAPALSAGESVTMPVLRSLAHARLKHVPVTWERATLSRDAGTQKVEVPAGSFEVEKRTVAITGGDQDRTWTFQVEKAAPHRIVQWERDDGLRARLLGEKRLPYWKLNDEGHEKHLRDLGLSPRAPAMP